MANEHEEPTQAQHSPSLDGEALHALAVRLLDYAGTENLRLLVGAASDQLPADIPLPEGSQLLGSLERDDDITVVFDSTLDAEAVVALYRANLTAAGWYEPVRRMYNSGFTFGTTTGKRDWFQFCRSRRGPSLELSIWQGDSQPTKVQLTFRRDGRHGACAHEERASPYAERLPRSTRRASGSAITRIARDTPSTRRRRKSTPADLLQARHIPAAGATTGR